MVAPAGSRNPGRAVMAFPGASAGGLGPGRAAARKGSSARPLPKETARCSKNYPGGPSLSTREDPSSHRNICFLSDRRRSAKRPGSKGPAKISLERLGLGVAQEDGGDPRADPAGPGSGAACRRPGRPSPGSPGRTPPPPRGSGEKVARIPPGGQQLQGQQVGILVGLPGLLGLGPGKGPGVRVQDGGLEKAPALLVLAQNIEKVALDQVGPLGQAVELQVAPGPQKGLGGGVQPGSRPWPRRPGRPRRSPRSRRSSPEPGPCRPAAPPGPGCAAGPNTSRCVRRKDRPRTSARSPERPWERNPPPRKEPPWWRAAPRTGAKPGRPFPRPSPGPDPRPGPRPAPFSAGRPRGSGPG